MRRFANALSGVRVLCLRESRVFWSHFALSLLLQFGRSNLPPIDKFLPCCSEIAHCVRGFCDFLDIHGLRNAEEESQIGLSSLEPTCFQYGDWKTDTQLENKKNPVYGYLGFSLRF